MRHQTARIDRPERDTRAHRSVDRRVQLRLIVHPVQAQAAGEVEQGLLLAQLAQHRRRGLQRGKLPVGVEDVEFAVVLAEGRAGIGGAGVAVGLIEALIFADDQGFETSAAVCPDRR